MTETKPVYKMTRWCISKGGGYSLNGNCPDHKYFKSYPDRLAISGGEVRTSRIIKVTGTFDNCTIETNNSIFECTEPHREFQEAYPHLWNGLLESLKETQNV